MTRVVGVVLVIAWLLLGLPEVTTLDVWLDDHVPRPDWLRDVATVISFVLSPGLAALFGVGLAVHAVRKRDARWLVLFGLCWSTLLVRYLYQRVRPIEFPEWSYPSGHTVAVTATAFTAVALLRRGALIATAAVLLIGACRLVMEMHWVTDVIGAVSGVVGVGLLAALQLGLVTSGRDVVPHFRRSRPDS